MRKKRNSQLTTDVHDDIIENELPNKPENNASDQVGKKKTGPVQIASFSPCQRVSQKKSDDIDQNNRNGKYFNVRKNDFQKTPSRMTVA